MRHLIIAAALMLGTPLVPATAAEIPLDTARLDQVPAEFTRHTREHRMWEIERNLERQERWERRRGYDRRRDYDRRGYGYGRGYDGSGIPGGRRSGQHYPGPVQRW